MHEKKYGKIYLIPTEMGAQSPFQLFPNQNLEIVKQLQFYFVENIRTARRNIKKMYSESNIDAITFFELDKHASSTNINEILNPVLLGNDLGIMSEAGMPCIADPGNIIVERAHELGIQIVPLVGPNSIVMALIASGFNGQNFVFHGYIPIKENRNFFIQNMEAVAYKTGQTQIFMETPYRNQRLFEELMVLLKPETKLCIATHITLSDECIKTKKIKDWKLQVPDIQKRPTIFVIG